MAWTEFSRAEVFWHPCHGETIISLIPRRSIGNSFIVIIIFFFYVKKKFNSKSNSKYNLNSASKQQNEEVDWIPLTSLDAYGNWDRISGKL